MFANMGLTEWLVIMVIAMLIFGHRLPSLARSMGSSIGEFKKGLKETPTDKPDPKDQA